MTYPNPRSAVQQYTAVGAQSAITGADPFRLVQMLMDGALDKIAIAKGHMERNETAEKGRYISWAISIVNGLRMSLNPEAGGEIAENLDRLYEYMERRLLAANVKNNVAYLDEVTDLMGQIRSAWVEISGQQTAQQQTAVATG